MPQGRSTREGDGERSRGVNIQETGKKGECGRFRKKDTKLYFLKRLGPVRGSIP